MQTPARILVLAISAAVLTLPAIATGKTYRWVDAQGKVHYGDQPPPKSAAVEAPPPTVAGTGAAPVPTPANPLSAEECKQRRLQLERYRAAAVITETDALGGKHEYSEADRQKLVERSEQAVRDGCAPGTPSPRN